MSLAFTSTPRVARRRAEALVPSAAMRAPAPDRLASHVAALALPRGVDRLAASLPAVVLLAVASTFAFLGVVGVVGLLACAGAGYVVLRRTAPQRRAAATERALPVVLDSVARQLRAGGSLAQAIAATEPPGSAPDLRRAWARLTDLIPLVGVTAALDEWASPPASTAAGPAPSGSVRLTAASLSLAASTGGSPARAIDGVAATLRSRLVVADEVRALSSQARASAAVIGLAPLAFGSLAAASDDRTRDFLASPSGLVLLAVGLALDALGAWWMSRLCRPPGTSS